MKALLFDLDGTLLDTAPDLVLTLNQMRKKLGQAPVSLENIRPFVSLGTKAMIKAAFGICETDPNFREVRQQFLDLYQHHLADSTQFFPNMEKVLNYLEQHHIPWGIVTNKMTTHTLLLLKALSLDKKPVCIICGDTLAKSKPDPEPIIHACQLLKQETKDCLFVGDSIIDVKAGKAAGTVSLVALYGYIHGEDPYQWHADGYIQDPLEIIDWLKVQKL